MGAYNFCALNQNNHPCNNGTKISNWHSKEDKPRRISDKGFPSIASVNLLNLKTSLLQQILQLTLSIQPYFMLKKPDSSIYFTPNGPQIAKPTAIVAYCSFL